MNRRDFVAIAAVSAGATRAAGGLYATAVPHSRCTIEDSFWSPWLKRNREVVLPHNFRLIRETGVLDNFEKAAGKMPGGFDGFLNSDEILYKAVEAASYLLAEKRDPELDRQVDAIIAKIAAAQQANGYLCTPHTIHVINKTTDKRFGHPQLVHELYLFGHLYEAAVAHYTATGKRTLLDVATRNADLVDRTLGPGKIAGVSDHPNIEQALIRLAEASNEPRYLRLARFLVDQRGRSTGGRKLYGEFCQDHAPITEQREAVGQAPRATYLYSAVADLARLQNDSGYKRAMDALWRDVAERKMYVTGGIGSRHDNEGFGPAYDLPLSTAYTETCAAVSFSMWNHRMFQMDPDSRYIDVLERTLYNNFLAGTSLQGDTFFYANPLQSDGKFAFNRGWVARGAGGPYLAASLDRKPWFYCACCPPNVARQLASFGSYVYAVRDEDVFVNLFVAGEARVRTGSSAEIRLRQQTRYPWDGVVRLEVSTRRPVRFALHVRVPGWAQGRPVPGDLYRYASNGASVAPSVRVNGARITGATQRGYAVLDREWKTGDVVLLDLPMPVRRVHAQPNVDSMRGRVAFERGPVVYCAEGVDNQRGSVLNAVVRPQDAIKDHHDAALLGGIDLLTTPALTLIPYYAWNNRGTSEMAVWFRTA